MEEHDHGNKINTRNILLTTYFSTATASRPSNWFKSHRGFFICSVFEGLVVATLEEVHLSLMCKFERSYEILKIGMEKGRPSEQEYLRLLMVSREGKEMFLIYYIIHTGPDFDIHVRSFDIWTWRSVTTKNFPRGVFSDLSKLIPMCWNINCPTLADLTEKQLQVLVLLEEQEEGSYKYYKWSEKTNIASSGLLQHLLNKGLLIPVEVVVSNNDLSL